MDRSSLVLYNSNMRRMAENRSIQNYNLFGESGDRPDVVHCETIAARSVLHEWEFAPHRHARLHQILLIESGGGHATIEGRRRVLAPMRVVNVPTGYVHGFSFVRGTRGWVLTIATEMLDEVLLPSEGLRSALSNAMIVHGTSQMRATMKQIFAEFDGRQFARAHILRALSAVLIGLVARVMVKHRSADSVRDPGLFQRFEALLEQHFVEHWTVSQYAEALSMSPTHLSRITRSVTGHPASKLIVDRILREARRNLVYTNLPISTIAYSLGFDDPAYFSRVFSAAVGFSPRNFREKVHG
jgi:AraC family transcriptional activator of pobA